MYSRKSLAHCHLSVHRNLHVYWLGLNPALCNDIVTVLYVGAVMVVCLPKICAAFLNVILTNRTRVVLKRAL